MSHNSLSNGLQGYFDGLRINRVWWPRPTILATWEVEIRRITV
jgi:hypothetical protein